MNKQTNKIYCPNNTVIRMAYKNRDSFKGKIEGKLKPRAVTVSRGESQKPELLKVVDPSSGKLQVLKSQQIVLSC